MSKITRRNFLKFGAAGVAGLGIASNFPILGRMALAATGDNFFTIAVISDTQNYTDGRYQGGTGSSTPGVVNLNFYMDQMNYLTANASSMNLAFVSHVGDIVQNGDGSTLFTPGNKYGQTAQNCEWLNALQPMDVLAGIGVPFGLVPGNHDYDNMDYSGNNAYPPLVSTAAYWKTFWGSQSQYFKNQPWYGGASTTWDMRVQVRESRRQECGLPQVRSATRGCPATSCFGGGVGLAHQPGDGIRPPGAGLGAGSSECLSQLCDHHNHPLVHYPSRHLYQRPSHRSARSDCDCVGESLIQWRQLYKLHLSDWHEWRRVKCFC